MHTTGVLGTLCSQLYRCGPRRGTVAIIGICLFLTAGTASSNEPDVDTFATERAPIRIAVIAHWGIEKARKAWFPIATYLAKELNWAVEIIPLALSDMDQTVRDQKIDFVIVNPGAYVELSLKYGISVLGTLEKHIDGYPISAFGGVVFAKADRSDLNSLPDLADKKLLAVSAISFGGFQVFLREIKKIGMDPDADNINIAFTDFPHDNVVTRVLAGDADAGVVRTGVLEAMAHEEKIDLNDVRIIGSRTHPRFPLAASTDLYPEWAFAKLNHVPEALAKDVLRALLTINDTHAAARAGRYSGWTVPLDYTPVHNLFKELKIGPYKPRHTLLVEFLQRYWMVVAFIVLLILGVVTYSLLARRLVTSRTLELRLANEDLLREGEERAYAEEITARLGRILENSWNEIYIFDATTYEFIQVNHGALANMGYSMDEMRNLTAYDIKPHFDRESFIAAVQPLVGGSQVFLVFETVHARKDRTIYPVEVRLQLLANENPPIFVAVIIDITERHRAEQEIRDLNASLERRVEERTCELRAEVREREMAEDKLRETEAKTRQIVNSAVDGIITIDEQGIILTYNRAAEDMFEYSVAEAVGKNISLLMPKNVAEQHDGYLENFHRTGIAKIIGMRREVVARRKNGSTFLMDLSVSKFDHGGRTNFVGMVRDITARKQAEYELQSTLELLQNTQAELVQTEKMASLGGLVAGISHEINTPVGVGVTAASHLKERADALIELFRSGGMKKSDFEGFLEIASQSTEIISTNLDRAADLIRSFKQVAVDQSSEEMRRFGLREYLDEVLLSLRPQLKKTAHTVTIKGDKTIELESYPGALSQIVTNLVMNSLTHAFDQGDVGNILI